MAGHYLLDRLAPLKRSNNRHLAASAGVEERTGLRWIKSRLRFGPLVAMRPAAASAISNVRRALMLKDILVHIPSERLIRPVVDGAVSLAVARAAHLDAVSVGYETANVGLAVDGGAAVAAVFELERERALARANAALAAFETEARNAGISYGLQALTDLPVEAVATVGASARLYDLTIVLQPEADRDTYDNTMPQEILFQSGGPVLFIPTTHKGPLELKRIGIAWDGSRLAARAVRDAAPFLTRAHAITIISINEPQESTNASAAGLTAHLARQGLTARTERTSADHADIQPTILSIAADTGLDLIVLGGYGHSRLQERILGGVTRGMLQSMTVPTLMSH
jgi:nucleotide-binding universal stress UspA family protein